MEGNIAAASFGGGAFSVLCNGRSGGRQISMKNVVVVLVRYGARFPAAAVA